jgi:hypothetical protein
VDEVIALEHKIALALPGADAAASIDARLHPVVVQAHDILCNGWDYSKGRRLDRLRMLVAALHPFIPERNI